MWPRWLQRQLDPTSPWWLPGDLAFANRTGRNWTVLGVPDAPARWWVDGDGLISPAGGAWALDWWVGAAGGWLLPSRVASLRQHLVGAAPVVETRLRVEGGEVSHRCWTDVSAGGTVVAVSNDSAEAVAIALSLRPVTPAGLGSIRRVRIEGGGAEVDGQQALRWGELPVHSAVSAAGSGDVAATVLSGSAQPHVPVGAECDRGWATAAAVWPLAPRSALRVLLPAPPAISGASGRRRPALPGALAPGGPADPECVAAGWAARARRGARLELPAGRLADAAEAVRPQLLLHVAEAAAGDPGEAAAAVVVAAATAGHMAEAGEALATWWSGAAAGRRGGPAGAAACLWALARWRALGGPPAAVSPPAVSVLRAVESLGSSQVRARSLGLRAGAALLLQAGERRAAEQASRWAAADPARGAPAAPTPGAGIAPGGGMAPGTGIAPAGGTSDAAASSGCWPPVGQTIDTWPPPEQPTDGWSTARAFALGRRRLSEGSDPSLPLDWVLGVASPTWTWPSAVHPQRGTGTAGPGQDPAAAAGCWELIRALVVSDGEALSVPTGRPALLRLFPWLPASWRGQPLEAHGLPTVAGQLSCALRWHGSRPAVLWEVDGDGPPVRLVAAGLDPRWEGDGRRGEALLADRVS